MVKPGIKKAIWILWLLVVPVGIGLTYHYFPPQINSLELDFFSFLLLISIVSAMPIVINNTPIFFIQWVTLAAFLAFGLFAELILTQVSLLVLMARVRLTKEQLFRAPLNSIMFFLISLLSGLFYYAVGGKHNADLIEEPWSFVIATLYPVVSYFLNQIFITLCQIIIYNRRVGLFGKDLVWETVTTIITIPIGFVLYILYQEVGLLSLVFVGVPFASLSIILALYYSSQKVNEYLQKATEIGHELAERLQVSEVIDLFIQKVTDMLPVDSAYILDVVDDELQLIRHFKKGENEAPVTFYPLRKNEGISGRVWARKKSVLFSSKKEWDDKVSENMLDSVESVLCVPIVRSNEVVGVLLLASGQKRAYEKSQLMIVDILCSYFAVALENAKHYKKTKENSERCALTKLYNYRYFEKLLTNEFAKIHSGERKVLSLIILDIDHFKSVNDTYGHQGGNEILMELAARLSSLIDNIGTVARYGGEEFVILLPDTNKQDAFSLAELVRQTIANRSFTVEQSIGNIGMKVSVPITASIGVATAPIDADDSLALIRHADRALYVGAKRAGRNRVAEYVK